MSRKPFRCGLACVTVRFPYLKSVLPFLSVKKKNARNLKYEVSHYFAISNTQKFDMDLNVLESYLGNKISLFLCQSTFFIATVSKTCFLLFCSELKVELYFSYISGPIRSPYCVTCYYSMVAQFLCPRCLNI